MDKFENDLVDLFDDELKEIKASRDFKKEIIKNCKAENKISKLIKRFWNYEVEFDSRVCVVAIIVIVIIPTVYIFNKAEELKENEVKIYRQNSLK